MKKKSGRNYAVGRGKPPVHTRFRKGRSGNPAGRPREVISFENKIAKILAKTQIINVGGENVSLTLEELLITSIVQNAIRCKNTKSIMVALDWVRELDAARKRKARQALKTHESQITRETLAKMTHEQRLELYNKTIGQDGSGSESYEEDDDTDDR